MVVMIRALFILVVLIAVPLVVVFGSPWVDRAWVDHAKDWAIDAWNTPTDSIATAATTESDVFVNEQSGTDSLAPRFFDTPQAALAAIEPVRDEHASEPLVSSYAAYEKANRPNIVERSGFQDSASPPHPHPRPLAVDQFSAIKGRLRDLGAAYFRLDLFEGPDRVYRFYCEFDEADRPFIAFDADLLRSMQHVLQQVEDWKRGLDNDRRRR